MTGWRPTLAWLAVTLSAMLVAGCGVGSPGDTPIPSDGVRLLLADPGLVGCPAFFIDGDLVPDAGAGIAIESAGEHLPIRWPVGYSGRHVGSAVVILDPSGTVVARTGTHVHLDGGTRGGSVWLACPIQRP